jgi:hypothetical protein
MALMVNRTWRSQIAEMPIRPNQKAYVCIHVFENTRPVKLVTRDEDGWCFLCGDVHPDTADSYRVVGAGHILGRDPTIRAIDNLPMDWEAERVDADGEWFMTPSAEN